MQIQDCMYRLSSKALIQKNNKILCLYEKKGVWSLPGGGVEHGEDSVESLKREITEETGLEVTNIEKNPVLFFTFQNWDGSYRANIVFKVQVKDINFIPNEECVDLKYFTKEEISKLKCNSDLENLIQLI